MRAKKKRCPCDILIYIWYNRDVLKRGGRLPDHLLRQNDDAIIYMFDIYVLPEDTEIRLGRSGQGSLPWSMP